MRSISRLFSAVGTLADSLLALAGVIDTATARLRLQLAGETEPHILEHAPQGDDSGDSGPPTANGRRRKAAAV